MKEGRCYRRRPFCSYEFATFVVFLQPTDQIFLSEALVVKNTVLSGRFCAIWSNVKT